MRKIKCASIRFRLSLEEKQEFGKICAESKTTPSKALRQYIREMIGYNNKIKEVDEHAK
ncbi:MAG: hypothetical protein WC451_02720 [Patescibacteria group bacterium]